MTNHKRHLITAALIYANGPVHIGHLAGCYLPSDIYVRYLRSKGEDVLFVSGTDEHGVPITLKARQDGISPKDVVDKYYKQIHKSFKDFGISFDVYSRTSKKIHHKTSSDFFLRLYEKKVFDEKESLQYFDFKESQFLSDRYITGECPCGKNKNAYGDQCEVCGRTLSPMDLKNPKSLLSGNKPELKNTKNWYLPMDKLQNKIDKYIANHPEWKHNVLGQCKSWLNEGLKPRAMTRDLNWGVKVPLKDSKGKVLYVWFDAPIGYISATKEFVPKKWEKYWKDSNTNLVHFIGKDNIVFHCIIFPMMLIEHGDYILPTNVPANEFMNLEGEKISTSKNWAVWLHDYLDEFPNQQDVLRYVLTSNAPESKDSDFTWKDFQAKNNNELVASYGNFINRVFVLCHKFFDRKIPSKGHFKKEEDKILYSIIDIRDKIENSIEKFKFREALALLMDLSRIGNKYLTDTEPWKIIKEDKERAETILYVSLQIVCNLAILSSPFLPFTSNKIFKLLNVKTKIWDDIDKEILKSGHKINESEHLFTIIEDELISKQIDKLKFNSDSKIMKKKSTVEFDDFSKIDLRVATVLEADPVPKSEKLLKLKVNTGLDTRIILSGIAKYYKPKELVDKQVMVIVNLQPRKMMGIESEGMLLLAEDPDGSLKLMQPEDKITNGSIVC